MSFDVVAVTGGNAAPCAAIRAAEAGAQAIIFNPRPNICAAAIRATPATSAASETVFERFVSMATRHRDLR